jgi:tyrosyl-tRNA synthetase
LITDVELIDLKKIKKQLDDSSVNPRDLKRQLARKIVEMYHSERAAKEAEAHFDKIHIKKEVPDEIPEFIITEDDRRLINVMMVTDTTESLSEGRRLIRQNSVSIDGKPINDEYYVIEFDKPIILKVGKRKFVKLVPKAK